jgi:hypothetical protein
MKKSTKTAQSPAPAIKPVSKKTAVAKATPAPAAAPKPAAKAAKPAAKAAPKPPLKPVAPAPVLTTITAKIDIGFGNALYIRGEGAGLSWDRGLLMNCVADDRWSIELGESARPVIYKFLVNDLTWSAGEDYTVAAGTAVTVVPTFEK